MQKDILKLFWRFSSQSKVLRALALLFPVLAVMVNTIVAPYVLSIFLNMLQHGSVNFANSWHLIAIYATLVLIGEVVLWRLALYFAWTFEINGIRAIYLSVFRKLAAEDLNFHANRFGGSLVSQTSKIIGSFERFWDMFVWSILPMLTTVIGSIIALCIVGLWQYGLFLIPYSLTFAVVVIFSSRFLAKRNREEAAASNKNSGLVADMVTNIGTVKAFGRERYEQRRAKETIDDWHRKSTHLKWGVIGATSAFSVMYTIGSAAAFVFAVAGVEYGIASVGMIYLMFIYTLNINRQLWELNSITRAYSRVIGDAHEMTEILNKPLDLIDNSNQDLHASNGKVVFDNVTFTHDQGEGEQVFKNFSLQIPDGQRVGLVGHSGSGKTTLTRILLRFSEIDSGLITIDGQNIRDVSQQSLHESVAYVAQEPILFHRSLRENIAYSRLDASDKDIIAATKKAHALEFIEKLPSGFETLVGERGVKLSGGQRQRIAIARAILKDAPILVLDEATSALDSESEKLIQASLETLMKGRTSIVIAHRLSTIAKLDRIVVLENGKIIEDGTHAELLKQNGTYAKLWSHQSGGFIEE
jgi:ATP-binding cassette subfamily B protein